MLTKIPKRIIQTAKTMDLSVLEKACAVNLRSLNPDFEYLFFDDEKVKAFIYQEFPNYCDVFESFRVPIQRYDFFRYLAIYRYGGFYFDFDVFLSSSLSSLLDRGCVFPFEAPTLSRFFKKQYSMNWEIGNYAFGAAPEHPFIQAVIENCVKAQKDPKWVDPMMREIPRLLRDDYYVLITTGPRLVSRTLCENPRLAEMISILLPDDIYDSCNWEHFGRYGVHLRVGSWRRKERLFRNIYWKLWVSWTKRRLWKKSHTLPRTSA
jgi:hypothetical protein